MRASEKPTRVAAFAPAFEFAIALFSTARMTMISPGPQTACAIADHGSLLLRRAKPVFGSAILFGPK